MERRGFLGRIAALVGVGVVAKTVKAEEPKPVAEYVAKVAQIDEENPSGFKVGDTICSGFIYAGPSLKYWYD